MVETAKVDDITDDEAAATLDRAHTLARDLARQLDGHPQTDAIVALTLCLSAVLTGKPKRLSLAADIARQLMVEAQRSDAPAAATALLLVEISETDDGEGIRHQTRVNVTGLDAFWRATEVDPTVLNRVGTTLRSQAAEAFDALLQRIVTCDAARTAANGDPS